MKRLIVIILISWGMLTACHSNNPSNPHQVRVGTIMGPETTLMEVAKKVAAAQHKLTVTIVPFNNYALPNEALVDGSIDANVFQHQPYLDSTIAAKGYPLVTIGKTFVYPMGLYSSKLKTLAALAPKSVVGIPNDPSNGARALLLLQKAGLIQLKAGVSVNATRTDIQQNPKQLVIKELDAAQLPRALADLDLAAINTNYAVAAGLLPSRDALFRESKDSKYANVIVVRKDEQHLKKFEWLVNALHSDAVLKEADTLFKGQAIPAW